MTREINFTKLRKHEKLGIQLKINFCRVTKIKFFKQRKTIGDKSKVIGTDSTNV